MTLTNALDAALDDALGPKPTPRPPRPPGLAPVAARAVPAEGGLMEVRLEDVHPSDANPRESLGDIPALADSIRENGLIQPIIVRQAADGRLIIVAGHRRYAAVKSLGHLRVEVIVRKDMPPDDELAQMLVENGQRAGLDPIEEARALMRLKTLGDLSDIELAKKIGRSQPTVSSRLALLSLPVEEQEMVRTGYMKVGAAVRVARIAAGKVRPTGSGRAWHLGPDHTLATSARARCRRLQHKTGRSVGGMACGECWESVIRADERAHLHQVSATQGRCAICNGETGGAL